jgi:hypothetical protein
MYYSFYQPLANKVKEGFQSYQGTAVDGIAAFLAMALVLVIQLFIVKFLWNNVFVEVVAFGRPFKSLLQVFGFLLLVAMVFP